jgi:hypothetical protein
MVELNREFVALGQTASHMPKLYRAATAAMVATSTAPPAYKSVLSVSPLVRVLIHFAMVTLHLIHRDNSDLAGQFRRRAASFVGHSRSFGGYLRDGRGPCRTAIGGHAARRNKPAPPAVPAARTQRSLNPRFATAPAAKYQNAAAAISPRSHSPPGALSASSWRRQAGHTTASCTSRTWEPKPLTIS